MNCAEMPIKLLVGSMVIVGMIVSPYFMGWIVDMVVVKCTKRGFAPSPWLDRWFLGIGIIGIVGLVIMVSLLFGNVILGR